MSSQDDLNALKAQINEMQQQLNSQQTMIGNLSGALQSAYGVSSDVVKTLTNAKTVGTNGNLGTLSHADTLSGAPVGDAARLRSDMGLGNLATKERLSDADAGDQGRLRGNMGLGELATKGKLSDAEVGDQGRLRGNMGLGELATKGRLSDADVGDQGRLRGNMGLGELATKGRLSDADVGDQGHLRTNLGLGELATKKTLDECDVYSAETVRKNIGCNYYRPKEVSEPNWAHGNNTLLWYAKWDDKQKNNVPEQGMAGITLYYDANPVQFAINMFSGKAYIRRRGADNWGGGNQWISIYSQANTTVDGSGAIKVASPIVRLIGSADSSAMGSGYFDGFSTCGCGAANDEAMGVKCERVGTGEYRVSGALGWHDDGVWHISTPKDANGQEYLWVDVQVQDDGTIIIKTYHRTHPTAPPFARNYIEGVNEGDPIDITPGKWIDLRLKMPKKPEPSP